MCAGITKAGQRCYAWKTTDCGDYCAAHAAQAQVAGGISAALRSSDHDEEAPSS